VLKRDTVTTAPSVGDVSRLTSGCSAETMAAPATTGSLARCRLFNKVFFYIFSNFLNFCIMHFSRHSYFRVLDQIDMHSSMRNT